MTSPAPIEKIAVVGLGKIGLPLAVATARRMPTVVGLDVSQPVVDTVTAGVPPFPNEPGLEEGLRSVIASGRLRATTDAEDAISGASVVIVVVPLVVDEAKRPDFSILDAATEAVGPHLGPGSLVVYETTMPVGTTRERLAPRLAELANLEIGAELFVCHSPERVSSGSVFRDLAAYPKLVGGVDPASTVRGVSFYERALEFSERTDLARPNGVWAMASSDAAELAKLAETTYRDVNIAFANELAAVCRRRGIVYDEVKEACNSQPYSHLHRPGLVGGHCIPVYPHLLMYNEDLVVPDAARSANESVAAQIAAELDSAIGGLAGKCIGVLGVAFRGGVKEHAFSGVFPLVAALAEGGATVSVSDPLYDQEEISQLGLEPLVGGENLDAVIVQADHEEYRTGELGASVVYDVRGVVSEDQAARVIRLGG